MGGEEEIGKEAVEIHEGYFNDHSASYEKYKRK